MTKKIAPGPHGTPISGHLWALKINLFNLLENSFRKYGDITRYRVLNQTFHLFAHPDQIHFILNNKNHSFSRNLCQSSRLLRDITGQSTLTLEGPEWVNRRKIVGPAFSKQALDAYTPLILEAVDEQIKQIKNLKTHHSQNLMSNLTAAIAGRTFFGSSEQWDPHLLEMWVNQLLDHHWKRIKSPADLIHRIPNNSKKKFESSKKAIVDIATQLLQHPQEDNTLLQRLAQSKVNKISLNQENIINEIITFLLAGHETTATTLTWCLYLLAKHPEWQAIIRDEFLKLSSSDLTASEKLPIKLPNTYDFISEALRLYPAVWLLERQNTIDQEIGGFHIPKNSSALISILLTHRHPEFWENPDDFYPQRFHEHDIEKSKLAYLPFGDGLHSCIGRTFALLECALILGSLTKNFAIKMENPKIIPKYKVGITLRMKEPLLLHFSAR